jgi:hypothetical protein
MDLKAAQLAEGLTGVKEAAKQQARHVAAQQELEAEAWPVHLQM